MIFACNDTPVIAMFKILDPEIFEHMHQNGDYTHFYFCYRWFLLDFKRGEAHRVVGTYVKDTAAADVHVPVLAHVDIAALTCEIY